MEIQHPVQICSARAHIDCPPPGGWPVRGNRHEGFCQHPAEIWQHCLCPGKQSHIILFHLSNWSCILKFYTWHLVSVDFLIQLPHNHVLIFWYTYPTTMYSFADTVILPPCTHLLSGLDMEPKTKRLLHSLYCDYLTWFAQSKSCCHTLFWLLCFTTHKLWNNNWNNWRTTIFTRYCNQKVKLNKLIPDLKYLLLTKA